MAGLNDLPETRQYEIDKAIDREVQRIVDQFASKTPIKPLAQRVFDIANSFHQGALRCIATVKHDEGPGFSSPGSPAIVNFAFAAELYLKSLLRADGDLIRGHRLSLLLSRLDEGVASLVREEYFRLTHRSQKSLEDDVAKLTNAFVEWRYVFEEEEPIAIAVHRLVAFTRALYRTARTSHPDWKIDAHGEALMDAGPDEQVLQMVQFSSGLAIRLVEDSPPHL